MCIKDDELRRYTRCPIMAAITVVSAVMVKCNGLIYWSGVMVVQRQTTSVELGTCRVCSSQASTSNVPSDVIILWSSVQLSGQRSRMIKTEGLSQQLLKVDVLLI